MKTTKFLFLAMAVIFTACSDRYTETVTYNINEPILMSADEFRASIKVTQQKHKIETYGKICFYNCFLYVAETEKGIHIIDNTNPQNPQIVGFIELLGNADLAIRNNVLYADMLTNLVWFDISNPAQPTSAGVLADAFSGVLPSIHNEYGIDYALCFPEKARTDSVIVGWKLVTRTDDVQYHRNSWWNNIWNGKILYDVVTASENGNSNGVSGSMSRFSLYGDYLYSVINNQMSVITLAGETPVKEIENIYIGWNVETIFNYKDAMFMGTPTGMVIYSVQNPLVPEYASQISHIYGCDPVVVENDLAYVTIHSGNFCGQSNNELFIIDVKDVKNPRQIASYSMTLPKGLGIDNNTLFICDDGLKIFRADNPQTIIANQLAHYSGMSGYDVIPFNNTLMMIAEDGIYQYDYSDLNNIKPLSKLEFGQ